MKLAIIGYGTMGREIEKIALQRNHEITVIIDNEQDWETEGKRLHDCDVAVEFTTPSVVLDNLNKCFKSGIPVVTGTTGWHSQIDEVSAACTRENAALFYASNFSIGVNIFFEINRKLASLLQSQDSYTPEITEIHHTRKKEAPSGTAISIAQDIISANKRYHSWKLGPSSAGEIPVTATREGDVPGTHLVQWQSTNDTISIRHEAKNRIGFAQGAILAAEFMVGKHGIFSMKDLLKINV
ncbi:MAG: 4-hydroxy-tetrahydrodipicolinate reductase [Bacteroidales bacterium]|nr:4-hydroxy-tetrahydrodipicolinate reductase [Bacteroidales bacterium]